ncbi:MAG: MMPL family transporter, partial [Thermoleophilaceae bacterium]|nr:MMPL family transporter [Thermoleophilaceae bacterium]
MPKRDWFARIVGAAARRPLPVVAVACALALGGAALALRLEPSTGTSTLAGKSSRSYEATRELERTFGGDAVVVLVQGNLQRTVLTTDLGRLLRLEGCLSGKVPPVGLKDLPAVCSWFARHKPAWAVYGPGTFLNTAADRLTEGLAERAAQERRLESQAADTARRLARRRGLPPAEQDAAARRARAAVADQYRLSLLQLSLRYGITRPPAIDNLDFVGQVVFDPARGAGQPKARFAYLFPSANSALVQVRMKPGLSERERDAAIAKVREAVAQRPFRLEHGQRYVVTGVPVVAKGLADAVRHSIVILLVAAVLVMAATLALVFRTRLRLLPLALALAAAALTFGAVSLAGGSLTMASIAVLPVLVGLAVDYAIQFQARYDEARAEGLAPAAAAPAAAAAGGPPLAPAGRAP